MSVYILLYKRYDWGRRAEFCGEWGEARRIIGNLEVKLAATGGWARTNISPEPPGFVVFGEKFAPGRRVLVERKSWPGTTFVVLGLALEGLISRQEGEISGEEVL